MLEIVSSSFLLSNIANISGVIAVKLFRSWKCEQAFWMLFCVLGNLNLIPAYEIVHILAHDKDLWPLIIWAIFLTAIQVSNLASQILWKPFLLCIDSDTSLHFLAASKQMRTLLCKGIVKSHPCALHLFPMDPGVTA